MTRLPGRARADGCIAAHAPLRDRGAAVSGNDRARSIRSRVVAQADGLADP
jgi:hypothetical protein